MFWVLDCFRTNKLVLAGLPLSSVEFQIVIGAFQLVDDGSFGFLLMLSQSASFLKFVGLHNHLVFLCIFLVDFGFSN